MDLNTAALSRDALDDHLLEGVVNVTAPADETAATTEIRRAVIVALFRAFEAADAMEAMIACHCLALQFVLTAAMRDANNTSLEPALLTRMRSSAMSISKTLHLWVTKFETLHARNRTRAAEALKPAHAKQPAVPLPPRPAQLPRQAAQTAAPPALPELPVIRHPRPDAPKRVGMKEGLLSSATVFPDRAPDISDLAASLTRPYAPTPARADATTPVRPHEPPPVHPCTTSPAHPDAPSPARPDAPSPARPDAPSPARPDAPTPARPDAPTPARPDAPSPARPDAPTPARPNATPPVHPYVTPPARPDATSPRVQT